MEPPPSVFTKYIELNNNSHCDEDYQHSSVRFFALKKILSMILNQRYKFNLLSIYQSKTHL